MINLKDVWKASPNAKHPMRSRSSSDNGSGQFLIGYLTAIAFKIGYTPDHLHDLHQKWRADNGGKLSSLANAHLFHNWIESRIAELEDGTKTKK